ncbi:hypothetical protein BJ138DRAFT_1014033 [Hygrophoropsis aurantiaca]|uniref:Uncharacterized protein n=1 Tax=Hygrophoropsis aurantiaca TaxID=72124 RepID=A0ACB8A359_9AGAM|nr:hypothetical protein BJ138DRAFT_1014033 [Hygrophoropsis aurantiaca]
MSASEGEEQGEIPSEAETEVVDSPPPSPAPQRRTPPQSQSPLSAFSDHDEAVDPSQIFPPLRAKTPPPPLQPFSLPPASVDEPSSSTPPGTPPKKDADAGAGFTPGTPTTPPRQRSFSASILEFRTPSPPHELPGPPSSSDDEDETDEAHELGEERTPIRQNGGNVIVDPGYTAMKTPKPPGAWAATPVALPRAPSSPSETLAPASTPLPRSQSYPEAHSGETVPDTGLLTPIPSLSRANSLPAQTPALPGAWMATPHQSTQVQGRRRSILKVRFDVTESEASGMEGPGSGPGPSEESVLGRDEGGRMQLDSGRQTNGSANGNGILGMKRPTTPERDRPTTPPSAANAPSPRSLRRSPSVRVVDEFGRERVDDHPIPAPANEERHDGREGDEDEWSQQPPSAGKPAPNPDERIPQSTSTPRAANRSSLRIVDAMGREIDDQVEIQRQPQYRHDSNVNIGHNEALVLMREKLRELAAEISDADKFVLHAPYLDEISNNARFTRGMLEKKLRVQQDKEQSLPLAGRIGSNKHKLLPSIVGGSRSWSRGWILCGIFAQLIIFLAMRRYAQVHARRLFHTTYYDPLYPDLYALSGSPSEYSHTHSWSTVNVVEAWKQDGWAALRQELKRTLTRIGDDAWQRWGEPQYAGQWPPT